MDDVTNTKVLKKINALTGEERIKLLDTYSDQIRDIHQSLGPQEYIDISIDILLLKSSHDELVNSYVNGEPVINRPGCSLNEFLNNELAD